MDLGDTRSNIDEDASDSLFQAKRNTTLNYKFCYFNVGKKYKINLTRPGFVNSWGFVKS